ncbi:lysylphosphatidylglycerol synthase domain-containing protein [Rhizobium sp. L1K21]|uniref:lysylphosphatidylglycerol synthase domain-containing protein n=1 Tax=Rhizobium sp. L1K21 TaxID=2954933 RepID=UPI0020922E11|nr:lysylphosphatidylglycerol synthase domain-containing protein [Rhizobium sp. L1K21]MCO6187796.1 lysylphosphatidylglycerol synthase domain-containing protein [Rhizobium sp. L1K21]
MKLRLFLTRTLTLAAIVIGCVLLYRNISRYSAEELLRSIYAIPFENAALSLVFTAASYVCLAGFDGTSLAYLGRRLPPPRVLLVSFVSLSIGHNVGVSMLSSGAIRYRYYARWGLTVAEVGQLIVFCGFTVALGIVTLSGSSMLLSLGRPQAASFLPPAAMTGLALALLAFPLCYLLAARFLPRHIRIYKWHMKVPSWRLALVQILVGTVNFLCVAACLYFLLKSLVDIQFIDVALGYSIANMLAILSHVPGGLGVLEAGLLYVLPGAVPFGALIAFRIVYFFIPLAFGVILFLATELKNLRAGRASVRPGTYRSG